ncbi:Hypothetical predicted protein [Podarcis lilfordi]|uniref:Uncharacterized protein n=1 Tax=Podarcis lilfordi TaxID=74358 RepID=A0AA35JR85_9SAUR|nr:Hypothetical predicted protein [Podarcis lilfordi]
MISFLIKDCGPEETKCTHKNSFSHKDLQLNNPCNSCGNQGFVHMPVLSGFHASLVGMFSCCPQNVVLVQVRW